MKFLRPVLFISLVLSSALSAQNPPRPGIPGLNGGESEGDPPPQNLTQRLQKPDPNGLYPGGLELLNIDGFAMASLYQSVTGKRVLVPSTVKDVQFSFVQAGGLTNREVAQLIEEFLLIEGYQLNPSSRNPDIVTLLGVNQAGGPANTIAPVKVLTDPTELVLENGIVTYVMKFQFLKPDEAQRAFTQVYGQLRPGGTIAEVRNASSLIITEKATLIQSLLKLKKEIDVPSAQVATDWVEIQYADVQELAEQLNQMFTSQGEQSAGVQRQQGNVVAPPIPGLQINAAAAGGGGSAGEENPPTITPDSRTNRLFLMGRPVDLVFIKELIAQWDVPSSKRNFLRRKLKYLPVFEFMPIAETAIGSTLGNSGNAAEGGGGGRSTANAPQGGLGNNGQNGGNNGGNNRGGNGGGGGLGGGGGSSAASLSGSDRPTQPESVLVGNTLLVSDNVANSIIVQGPPHHIEIVEALIDELDVKNEQIAITAVFGRYNVVDGLSFGTNLGRVLEGNGVGFTSGGGGAGGVIDGSVITQFADLAASGLGLSAGGIFGDFGVFISAVENYTNMHTFARPTIFTTNNKEARISSGMQIAIPTSTFQGGTATGQSTNIEFIDVALELLVRPLVNSSEEITLEISITQDSLGALREVGDLNIPDLSSDQLETTVTIPVGSAVLLGGVINESEESTRSGVPILRSIPLLGNLFRNNDDEFARTELVIMIRPTIVDGKVDLQEYQDFYDHGSNASKESRAHFGAPRYVPRQNSSVDRVFRPNKEKAFPPKEPVSPLEGPSSTPSAKGRSLGPRPLSPIQQAIYDKKKRILDGQQKR